MGYNWSATCLQKRNPRREPSKRYLRHRNLLHQAPQNLPRHSNEPQRPSNPSFPSSTHHISTSRMSTRNPKTSNRKYFWYQFLGMSFNDAFLVIFKRALVFLGDLCIYVFIWPWPREFFAGRTIGNPIAWRLAVGFRPQEIIVRRSRKWDRTIGNVLEVYNHCDEDGGQEDSV